MDLRQPEDPIPDALDPQDSLAVFWVLQLAEEGQATATVEYTPSPAEVRRYLEQADRPAIRGVLVDAVLRLRRLPAPDTSS
ncbi:MAG: hypothetical protein IT442_10420 [Phycisphaeraceae bacterium]|nr:hypothetical protein [Phycisphaeraceae bacterium]